MTSRAHIAVFHTWPDTKNAEYELILRIIEAGRNVGIDVTIIDNEGYPIWPAIRHSYHEMDRISHKDCDFAISLHFESPKVIDIYTYVTLWNPQDFYFIFGYEKSVTKLITHDDAISCDSDMADAHALNLFRAIGRAPQTPLPRLHASLSRNVYEPNVTDEARVFYIGINWERINSKRGRHHDLLVALDDADLIDIYGPEFFHGVKPWEGFSCYRGSIPFDGRTTIKRIAEAGICLAFSSAAHQRSGIMTSRLFEGLAAGALVVANKHPFLERFFGDTVLTVDDSLPTERIVSEIKDIVRWARRNPELATEKARQAQEIFLERFAFEDALTKLVDGHAERIAMHRPPSGKDVSITAIVVFLSTGWKRLDEMLNELAEQINTPRRVILVIDEVLYGMNQKRFSQLIEELPFTISVITEELFEYAGPLESLTTRKNHVGPAVFRALRSVDTDLFFIQMPPDELFSSHLSSLVRTLTANPNHLAAASGTIAESKLPDGRLSRRIEDLGAASLDTYLYAHQTRFVAQHLYRRQIIDSLDEAVFMLTDGQEFNYLSILALLQAGVAWSQTATLVYREHEASMAPSPVVPIEQQHQFIRDAVRSVPARLELMRHSTLPPVVFSTPTGAPVQWANLRRPSEIGAVAIPGVRSVLANGGDGLKFMSSGFSYPEENGIWIEGRTATLEFTVGMSASEWRDVRKIRFTLEILAPTERASRRNQHATIMVNGVVCGYLEIMPDWCECIVDVSREVFGDERSARLRLVFDHAEPFVDAAGTVLDTRQLSAHIRSFMVEADAISSRHQSLPLSWPRLLHRMQPGKAGENIGGRIRSLPGIADFVASGPYLQLQAGTYRMMVQFIADPSADGHYGRGFVEVVYGDVVIGVTSVLPTPAPTILEFCLPQVWAAMLSEPSFEIRIWNDGTSLLEILDIELQRIGSPGPIPLAGVPNWLPLLSIGEAGALAPDSINAPADQSGCVFFGPYRSLPPGEYQLVVVMENVTGPPSRRASFMESAKGARIPMAIFEVSTEHGEIVARGEATPSGPAYAYTLPFTISAKLSATKLEFRLLKPTEMAFTVRCVRVEALRLDRVTTKSKDQDVAAIVEQLAPG